MRAKQYAHACFCGQRKSKGQPVREARREPKRAAFWLSLSTARLVNMLRAKAALMDKPRTEQRGRSTKHEKYLVAQGEHGTFIRGDNQG